MRRIALPCAEVSPLGLGTAGFGTSVDEKAAMRQLDCFAERGNLLDTAHVYGDWVPGEKARSERVIGKWLVSRGARGRVTLSTKGAHPRLETMRVSRVSPENIRRDLEESLRCLNTDFIDIYFLHRDDPARPVGELLECLEALRAEGKIRGYGCSNWRLERIREAQEYARRHGLQGLACNQLMWSLAAPRAEGLGDPTMVGMDAETYAFHERSGMPAMGYMALAKGYFSRRQNGKPLPESVRALYDTPENDAVCRKLLTLSERSGLSAAALAILYFSAQPFAAVPLVSFSSETQLEDAMTALACDMTAGLAQELRKLRERY